MGRPLDGGGAAGAKCMEKGSARPGAAMTVRHAYLTLCLPLLAAGCKSADKGGPLGFGVFGSKDATPTSAGGQRAAVDPLLTNGRIPPQNLPVPGKDGNTLAGRDPLFGSPAARDDRPERTDRTAANGNRAPVKQAGETSSIPRVSVPYRPTRGTTPAALAARIDPRDPAYQVGDDPPPLSLPRADRTAEELKRLGVVVTPPAVERGEYVCRGEVELDPDGRPGVRRAYEATGATREAALRQLLEQVRGDLKR